MSIVSGRVGWFLLLGVLLCLMGQLHAQDGRVHAEPDTGSVVEQDDVVVPTPDGGIGTQALMVIVPSAGFVADRMVIAALKAGSASASAKSIAQVLSLTEPVTLVVGGSSPAVSLATFERAIREIGGRSSVPHRVAYKGKPAQVARFRALAGEAGLEFIE